MPTTVTETVPGSQARSNPTGGLGNRAVLRYVTEMATRGKRPVRPIRNEPERPAQIRRGAHPHLYVREHMKDRGMDISRLAHRLEQHPKSISRSLKEQSRIWEKIEAWAFALGLEDWRDLTMPPGHPSLDARIDRLPKEFQEIILKAASKG